MTTQKEIEDLTGLAYEMERRLSALKNAYAENPRQKRDDAHSYRSYAAGFSVHRVPRLQVSREERYHMIAKEAYFRSRQHGFDPARLARDWTHAEAEVDRILRGTEAELPAPHHDATLHGHE